MIKNIILDVGGIIIDDRLENISKIFGKDMSIVYKKVYGGDFKYCILGSLSMTDYLKRFYGDSDYKYIREMLDPTKQEIFNPLLKENYEYICGLKGRGYHLYILSNLTKETYDYLNSIIDINKYFEGAFLEHLIVLDIVFATGTGKQLFDGVFHLRFPVATPFYGADIEPVAIENNHSAAL